MSWSYGREVMAHEATHAAAMRAKEHRHGHRDPDVSLMPSGSLLPPHIWANHEDATAGDIAE
jgi:hypothetical protein